MSVSSLPQCHTGGDLKPKELNVSRTVLARERAVK